MRFIVQGFGKSGLVCETDSAHEARAAAERLIQEAGGVVITVRSAEACCDSSAEFMAEVDDE